MNVTHGVFPSARLCFVVTLTSNAWSNSACKHVFFFEPVGALISTVISQMILGSRVYAIYGQSKPIAAVLSVILVTEIVIGGISISTTSPPLPVPGPPSAQPPCGAVMGPFGWLIAFWTIPLLYDSLTFLLTAWKAYDFWKKEVDTPIFDVIWRDGLLYFFAIFTMNAANVIIFLTVPKGLRAVNLTPTLILEIVLSCRLILNLRGSHNRATSRPYQGKGSASARLRSDSHPTNGTSSEEKTARHFEETAVNLQPIQKVNTYNSDIKVARFQGEWNSV
ncbi:hypothetical protein CVT25_004469 [Psilocybe cyanescens]|uniref:Uncharacterized protein n=1 Tax=Psilocybe cyanescens TaxID=93625 RepID=A0A409X2H7_PSICY|nr:hypothetical protein CVT25_004469 [Psilocybe cyanescens]